MRLHYLGSSLLVIAFGALLFMNARRRARAMPTETESRSVWGWTAAVFVIVVLFALADPFGTDSASAAPAEKAQRACADSCGITNDRVAGFGNKYETAGTISISAGIRDQITYSMKEKSFPTSGTDAWWKSPLTNKHCFTGFAQTSMCHAGRHQDAKDLNKAVAVCGGKGVLLGTSAGATKAGFWGGVIVAGFGGGECLYNRWVEANGWD